jgi:hypothetical protein
MSELERLLKMDYGDTIYLNWCEDGGAEVTRSLLGWILYEVPQYGGIPRLYDIYAEDNLQELIDEANSWT